MGHPRTAAGRSVQPPLLGLSQKGLRGEERGGGGEGEGGGGGEWEGDTYTGHTTSIPPDGGVDIVMALLGDPVPLLLETATVTLYCVPSIRPDTSWDCAGERRERWRRGGEV